MLLFQLHHSHNLLLTHLALKTIYVCYFSKTSKYSCATIFVEVIGSILKVEDDKD